jgi:uncharacterized protein YacL
VKPRQIAGKGLGISRSDLQRVPASVDELGVNPVSPSGTALSCPTDASANRVADAPGESLDPGSGPALASTAGEAEGSTRKNRLLGVVDGYAGRDPAPRRLGDVLFVEVFRLFLVIAGVIGGLAVGDHVGRNTTAPLIGITLGALITYLAGGIAGRFLDRGVVGAVHELRQMPAGEVFAGSVVGTTGLLAGLVAGLPLIALVHSTVDYPAVAALAWVLCAAGARLGVTKAREIMRAAGFSHLVERPVEPPPHDALVIDTSAVMDRNLLVLGRSGLLAGGIVIPRFVVDEVRTLAEGPDPVSSRRARRGLEAIESLRTGGVTVRMSEDEVPELEDAGERALAVAHRLHTRLGTCASELAARAEAEGIETVDLRRLVSDLAPDHPPGEHLVIDLVKEGRQPRQAVGYLPEGDMVVVNDASHLVGREHVDVVVSSARQTTQGFLVFAHLFGGGPSAVTEDRSVTV